MMQSRSSIRCFCLVPSFFLTKLQSNAIRHNQILFCLIMLSQFRLSLDAFSAKIVVALARWMKEERNNYETDV